MENQTLTPDAEKAIDRAAKLFALAKNNDNEAEATSAMDAAIRILEAHNLDVAMIERRSGTGKALKREDKRTGGGLYKWQRTLWKYVAELNFCRYVAIRGLTAGSKYENRVVGSQVNVLSTTLMGEYLQQTIERLAAQWVRDNYAPGTSRFISDAIQYREGMADRIASRLWDLRNERAEAQKRERDAMPRGDGTALILADVVDAENDANDDVLHGLEPGTHARWREERNVRRAKAEAEAKRILDEREAAEAADPRLKAKREAEEAKAQAKAEAENAAWWRKQRNRKSYSYRETAADRRRQSEGYRAGSAAGHDISLDRQVDDQRGSRKLLK